jgi:hypothetical protein
MGVRTAPPVKETKRMKRNTAWLIAPIVLLGILAEPAAAPAAGVGDFQLTRAIPADAMFAMHKREHAGRAFLQEQYDRVWAAVEKQNFGREFKRLMQGVMEEQGGDLEGFDEQWRRMSDLAAGVHWGRLIEREMAYSFKLTPPMGSDFVILMMPPKETVGKDFEALSQVLKSLLELDEQGMLQLTTDGSGDSVVHRVSMAGMIPPLSLTLARQGEVILVGFGSSMVEQSLALLRGESDPAVASLASTARFKQAMAKLPPPADEIVFADIAKIMQASKSFAQLAVMATATQPAEAGGEPESPMAFLMEILDEIDLWEYAASVATTSGMKTTTDGVTLLRSGARSRDMGKVFYADAKLNDPLKFIPKEATAASAMSGLDIQMLYKVVVAFIREEVPDGEMLIAQWDAMKQELPVDVEEHLLSWIGTRFYSFTAPIPTPFMPGNVLVMKVRDQEKAQASLDLLGEMVNGMLESQGAGIEDAAGFEAEGFKRVILPPFAAMIPMLGKPMYGLKDGYLFLGNGPEVVELALKVSEGEHDNFSKNEQFMKYGLPLSGDVTGFSYTDLSNWGQQMSQMLGMVGMVAVANPEITKDPLASSALIMVRKFSSVVRELNFYRSKCVVKTMDGNFERSQTVLHYQEPPRPKRAPKPSGTGSEESSGEGM